LLNPPQDTINSAGLRKIVAPKIKKVSIAPKTDALEFDSKFESGNLAAAIQLSPQEYDLILQNDSNTQGYIQWFFFRVKAAYSGLYQLNLVNHSKSNSLFNYGMRVLVS